MNLTETHQLVDWLSALDNREVTPERVKAWHEVLGYLDFEQAKEAAIEAKREIQFVDPHNIISYTTLLDRKAGRQRVLQHTQGLIAEEERRAKNKSPMPMCVHNIGLPLCNPCCHNAAVQAGLIK
jgi:hypothetical protein